MTRRDDDPCNEGCAELGGCGMCTPHPSELPAPPEQATRWGHTPEWDPPAAMTAANRWTCLCGATVIDYLDNVYGSATEEGTCPVAKLDAGGSTT